MTDTGYNKAATVLGIVGTILWCIQLLPQIYTNFRRKSTDGLPHLMPLLWAYSGILFGIYFLVLRPNLPLMIQPEIFTFLCFVVWAQCLYYGSKFSFIKTVVVVSVVIAFSAGIQTAATMPLLNSSLCHNNGTTSTCWPLLLIGVLAAVLIFVGLVPPYFELWRRQGQVVGISFLFLAIDSSGAIFSLVSILLSGTGNGGNRTEEYLGMALYIIVPLMEAGIVLSHFVWWLRIGRHEQKSHSDVEMAGRVTDAAKN
ncbi:PQ loop repeat-domain-containing protein [Lipomyces kononenkoae]|uniref:PQ loop repeat-domain-containing protein n=1 Tax=Lipomyces kononenkoae TaxID=34357 RepID=A0ACC3T1Z4_LIPKO